MKNVLLVLGAPLWFPLLVALFAVMFSLVVAMYSVVISLLAAFVSLIACGLFAGIGSGIYFVFSGHFVTGLALFGCGLFALGLSILFYYASVGTIKGSKYLLHGFLGFVKGVF